jgi:hypothetical protein
MCAKAKFSFWEDKMLKHPYLQKMKNAVCFPLAAPLAALIRRLTGATPPSPAGSPASAEPPLGAAAGLPDQVVAVAPGGPPQPEAAP